MHAAGWGSGVNSFPEFLICLLKVLLGDWSRRQRAGNKTSSVTVVADSAQRVKDKHVNMILVRESCTKPGLKITYSPHTISVVSFAVAVVPSTRFQFKLEPCSYFLRMRVSNEGWCHKFATNASQQFNSAQLTSKYHCESTGLLSQIPIKFTTLTHIYAGRLNRALCSPRKCLLSEDKFICFFKSEVQGLRWILHVRPIDLIPNTRH